MQWLTHSQNNLVSHSPSLSLEFTPVSFVFSAPLYATAVLTKKEIPSQLNGVLCASPCSQYTAVITFFLWFCCGRTTLGAWTWTPCSENKPVGMSSILLLHTHATAKSYPLQHHKQVIRRTVSFSFTICPSLTAKLQCMRRLRVIPYVEGYQINLVCDFKQLKKVSHFEPDFFLRLTYIRVSNETEKGSWHTFIFQMDFV